MELAKGFRNELLKRREVHLSIEHPNNPGFESARKHVSEKFKADVEAIAIKSLKNNFGSNQFLIEAFVYDSPEHKEKTEQKPKVKKKAGVGA